MSGPCLRAASSRMAWHGYDGLSVWPWIRGHMLASASESIRLVRTLTKLLTHRLQAYFQE